MIKNTRILILFLLIIVFTVMNFSGNYKKINDFVEYIKKADTLKIKFNQANYNYFGNEKIRFKGYLWYKPDKKFRIEYISPEKEIIITNENGFRDYTAADREVVKGKLKDIVFISPFSLLYDIDKYFKIKKTDKDYKLISKGENTGDIKQITLSFKKKVYPHQMLVDMYSGSMVIYNFDYIKSVNYNSKYFNFNTLKTFFSLK